jgi:hypothetical protein
MALLNLPAPYAGIDEMLEQGDIKTAREALAETRDVPAIVELLEIKILLLEGALPEQLAMNRLLVLMRKDAKLPGAHELYRQTSSRSYAEGSSSMSHSHPPPPSKPKDGQTK